MRAAQAEQGDGFASAAQDAVGHVAVIRRGTYGKASGGRSRELEESAAGVGSIGLSFIAFLIVDIFIFPFLGAFSHALCLCHFFIP